MRSLARGALDQKLRAHFRARRDGVSIRSVQAIRWAPGFAIAALLSASLAGCVLPGTVAPPTAYPQEYIPTVVYLTAVSIDAAARTANPPTLTPSPTSTFMPATLAPTESPTPGPQVPLAAIQVRSPGPMSRIVSPMPIQLLAVAGDSKRVEVALFGEDGRLLGRSLIAVPGDSEGDLISFKLPFEIRAVGEKGFLQASSKDGRGRVQSLITVPVLLLSSGESQVNPPGNTLYERVALAALPPEAKVSGGVVAITGQVMPYNDSPMVMELISEGGESLSLRVLNIAGQEWQPIQTTLPYRVSAPTSARLFLRQADAIIDGDAYIYSQLILLNP